MQASNFSIRGVLGTRNKSKTRDCERNLSPMILKGNQMVYSWNLGIISLAFCQNSNNFPRLKARKINRILTKRAWNYSLISLVTIWLHIPIISNYWMRLSRIWRILQIKEGVIHRGRKPRWITPSKICRILHILRKPNSIIALLFIQNVSSFLKEFRHYALCFSAHQI